MEEPKNNPATDLHSQLKLFGQGLQLIFEIVEDNFLELEHKLSYIKDPSLVHHTLKSRDEN